MVATQFAAGDSAEQHQPPPEVLSNAGVLACNRGQKQHLQLRTGRCACCNDGPARLPEAQRKCTDASAAYSPSLYLDGHSKSCPLCRPAPGRTSAAARPDSSSACSTAPASMLARCRAAMACCQNRSAPSRTASRAAASSRSARSWRTWLPASPPAPAPAVAFTSSGCTCAAPRRWCSSGSSRAGSDAPQGSIALRRRRRVSKGRLGGSELLTNLFAGSLERSGR